MRTRWAILVACLQLGVIAYLAGEREWVLRTGQSVFLRTAPADPRDPMRGDYVRFNYETSAVPKKLCRDGAAAWFNLPSGRQQQLRDAVVYVSVKLDEHGVAEITGASDVRPEGLCLRGRVLSVDPRQLRVRYGLEAMFTQQKKAQAFELEQSRRPGVPLNIEAAVSRGGLAVLKSYRWEPLGITVTVDRPPATARPTANDTPDAMRRRATATGATVELKNHSDKPVAIVTRPNGRMFRLVPSDWAGETTAVEWVGANESLPAPMASDVKVLQPGEAHREHIDLNAPAWFLRPTSPPGPAVAWSELKDPWSVSPRIEYVAPSRAACAGLPQADLVYHTRLRSAPLMPRWAD